MIDIPDEQIIGRVLRSSTAGFSAGARVNQIGSPSFGMVVKAQPRDEDREAIYGLLYNIHIDDDPLVKQMVLAENVTEEAIRDHRNHRIVPIEMSVLAIAYRANNGFMRHALPPRPPMSLDPVCLCSDEEIQEVMTRFDFFQLVFNAQVPSAQLLAAALMLAAATFPEEQQYDYLVSAGREAGRLLSGDMARLDNLLRLIYPAGV